MSESGDNRGKMGKGHQGTCLKDHGQSQRGLGLRMGGGGGKMDTNVLEQQKNKSKKISRKVQFRRNTLFNNMNRVFF